MDNVRCGAGGLETMLDRMAWVLHETTLQMHNPLRVSYMRFSPVRPGPGAIPARFSE
jgi:hypothetical protein